MGQAALPEWEADLVAEAIKAAEARLEKERERATRRAVQLAREQGYHRLAVAIDRPDTSPGPDQLCLFDHDLRLFDDAG